MQRPASISGAAVQVKLDISPWRRSRCHGHRSSARVATLPNRARPSVSHNGVQQCPDAWQMANKKRKHRRGALRCVSVALLVWLLPKWNNVSCCGRMKHIARLSMLLRCRLQTCSYSTGNTTHNLGVLATRAVPCPTWMHQSCTAY
jgi:hypothetical protein